MGRTTALMRSLFHIREERQSNSQQSAARLIFGGGRCLLDSLGFVTEYHDHLCIRTYSFLLGMCSSTFRNQFPPPAVSFCVPLRTYFWESHLKLSAPMAVAE